jgi:site-specific DNA-adenine methylase
MKTKAALSYFGSDSEVAGQLAAMLNQCSHVTIPFCGGMSILPHLQARAIVANDMNDLAINFYRHASGAYGDECRRLLFDRCQHTLSHPSELDEAVGIIRSNFPEQWEQSYPLAWAYWATCWIGRKGQGGTVSEGTGMPSVRWTANGGTNASRIRAAADDLPEWAKHLERCEWLCEDFGKLLPKVTDDVTCGVYCDPPWRGLGDGYIHRFTDDDHSDLRDQLERFTKTTVVVRYGDDPFVRELYSGHPWTIIDAESRTQSNAVKGEIWIANR